MPTRPSATAARSLAIVAIALALLVHPAPGYAWEGAGLQPPGPAVDAAPTARDVQADSTIGPMQADSIVGAAQADSATEASARAQTVAPIRAVAIEDAAFRLDVPFRTQKDGGRWQTSNCGPAALGMVLDGFGIAGQATDDLRFRAHTYQGTVGMRTGTALQHIAHVAEDFGVPTFGLYDGEDRFHTWTNDEIRAQLRAGRPVMPLVRLYLLPGYEGMAPRWGHYVLVTGIAPDGFYYSDPLKTDPADGTARTISAAQLERAMAASHIPGQAVAFGTPRDGLPAWAPTR